MITDIDFLTTKTNEEVNTIINSEIITVCIQIGNSDDKLLQAVWANYVRDMKSAIDMFTVETHFYGGPSTADFWQNYCWVFDMYSNYYKALTFEVRRVRQKYLQDSVAILMGTTEFV